MNIYKQLKEYSLRILILISLFLLSCSQPNNPVGQNLSVSYDKEIKPYFVQKCVRCHSDFTTYTAIISKKNNDDRFYLVAGDTTSLLLEKMRPSGSMFKFAGTPRQIERVEKWIVTGLLP